MDRILAGIETEYGIAIEGRGAENQIDDATALVRSYPGECFVSGWDYSIESPRSDLRGFKLENLAFDPEDAKFDQGRSLPPSDEIRSDRVLKNGARFYNDHGQPEYATPETWGLDELVTHDKAGEAEVLKAAKAYSEKSGRSVQVYKNNTDFHGASYGTHESYLVPRELGFERLYQSVLPILIARQILSGAGKVGSESGDWVPFQISQRADFFVEPANAETLYRRPIFNTRDEPHADPRKWIRLHVISGDANMNTASTRMKLGLVKLAVMLEVAQEAPKFRFVDPVKAFKQISRGLDKDVPVDLEGGSWTTAKVILESYLETAERVFDLDPEMTAFVDECHSLLAHFPHNLRTFGESVDWAAKYCLLNDYREDEGLDWRNPMMQSLDLAYCNIDPEESLFYGLVDSGMTVPQPTEYDLEVRRTTVCEPSRAFARSAAVTNLSDQLQRVSWSTIQFKSGKEVHLPPDKMYGEAFADVESEEEFTELIQGLENDQL